MSENYSSRHFFDRHQTKILVSILAITASFAAYQSFVLRRYKKIVDDLLKKLYPEDYPKG